MLPWQVEQWQSLQARLAQGRLPHALLLAGPAGLGKRQFAEQFAASLLCHNPAANGEACGVCRGCQLLAAESHPDIARIVPEEEGKAIKVDQVRKLADFTVLSAQFEAGYKVVILDPAEAMNRAAANSLLKTLEEPAERTILILVTSTPQRLLATIRSRCQRVDFTSPDFAMACDWLAGQGVQEPGKWLEMAESAPLAALALAQHEASSDTTDAYLQGLDDLEQLLNRRQDPVAVAAGWQKPGALQSLRWLSRWVMDMIRYASLAGADRQPPHVACPGEAGRLQVLGNQLELKGLHEYLGRLNEACRLAAGSQVNQQMLLEEMLIRWTALPRH